MKSIFSHLSNNFIKLVLITLFLHLIVPIFSRGFLHPDEQYYVLDYTFEKLNLIVNYEKSWEFLSGIRSFTLPWILYLFALALKTLGINNPHTLSTILRIISSVSAFICQLYFLKNIIRRYSFKSEIRLLALVLLAWPLILMHSRTNTENWSTSFLLLALGCLLSNKNKFFAGALLAISFFIRFQIAFLILPLIYFYRKDLTALMKILLGASVISLPLIFLDCLEYKQFIITPFNYFMVNIFEGKVNTFGTNPFYFYAYKTITKLLPLLGIGIVISLIIAIKNFKKEPLYFDFLILIAPFLIIHHLIGHKELRFIYPLLPFFIIVLAKTLEDLDLKKFKIFVYSGFFAYPVLFTPLYKPIDIYRFIYDQNIIRLHIISPQNPFEIRALLPHNFSTYALNSSQKMEYLFSQNYPELLVAKTFQNCIPQKSTYPWWLIQKNPFNLLSRSSIWVIFKCNQI